MVEGVVKEYEKKLHVIGVGYGVQAQGTGLNLSLGLSHKVVFPLPEKITAVIEQDAKGNSILTLTSIDKQLVGEIAAKIRDLRKPEPYKGKGIRYFGEEIKLKAGKAAK
jgi:large subunit ribosomal protein L6